MNYTVSLKSTSCKKSHGLLPRLESLAALRRLTRLYSRLIEQPLTPRQTLHLLNAQLAGSLLLMTASAPCLFLALELAWFAAALSGCARALRS